MKDESKIKFEEKVEGVEYVSPHEYFKITKAANSPQMVGSHIKTGRIPVIKGGNPYLVRADFPFPVDVPKGRPKKYK